MIFVRSFLLLLALQLAGEAIARGLMLPLPGPVLGMAFLFILFRVKPRMAELLRPGITALLGLLSLLFVPAGVGVMANLELLSEGWFAIFVALFASTLLAILASVATFLAVQRLQGRLGK